MMKFLAVLCVLGVATASVVNHEPFSDEMIDYINNLGTTWKAGNNFQFIKHNKEKLNYVKRMCGVIEDKLGLFTPPEKDITPLKDLPTNFDSRTQWSNCASLSEVRDQGDCGSCWAFGAVEALTDRFCIASNGTKVFHLSAEDLMTCCRECGNGCNGGFPAAAWSFFKQEGVVTGGPYNSKQGCQPYLVLACDHHVVGHLQPCPKKVAKTPKCSKKCEDGYSIDYKADKHMAASTFSVRSEEKIQTEIMTNGPVEAAFTVYADFPTYKSGVYEHKTGQALGGHAVKIIGWGVDDSGTKFWTVANSWNADWGNKGFFNIKRGVDECGIESQIVAGMPKL